MRDITSATRVVALLGDPVIHSLSPIFQNAALRAADLDGIYVAFRCAATEVQGLLRGIALSGGAGNVTVPHKEIAALALDSASDAVRRTGACNTFWLEDGRVCGDNTDVVGFVRAARTLVGGRLRDGRVLLIGAGGSARAAVAGLLDEGAADVTIVNRGLERAFELRARFADGADRLRVAPDFAEVRGESFDLVVNATALGLRDSDPHPLPEDAAIEASAVLDLVYSPGGTPWVREQRSRGVPAADGLEMLLQQGAAAFERWWGIPAPLEAMRDALPFD